MQGTMLLVMRWTTSRREQDPRGRVNQNDRGEDIDKWRKRPRCGQPSDRGRLKTEYKRGDNTELAYHSGFSI